MAWATGKVIFITGRIAAYYAEVFRQSSDLDVFEIHSRMTPGDESFLSDGALKCGHADSSWYCNGNTSPHKYEWVRLKWDTPKSTCQSWISVSYIPDAVTIWHGVSLVLNYSDLAQRYLCKVIPALDRHRKLEATAASESYRLYRRNIEHRIYNLYIPIHYEQTPNKILLLILATLTYYTYIYSTYSLPHQAVDEMTSVSH